MAPGQGNAFQTVATRCWRSICRLARRRAAPLSSGTNCRLWPKSAVWHKALAWRARLCWGGLVNAVELARRVGLGRAVRLSDGPVARGQQGLGGGLETPPRQRAGG